MPLVRVAAQVELLLERLALKACADVKIGDPLSKGISGGQAKRTNVRRGPAAQPRECTGLLAR
jgi:ATP-binding cassette subfamily G (WHITE) protein 2